jgi:hypothetical protein
MEVEGAQVNVGAGGYDLPASFVVEKVMILQGTSLQKI